MKNKNKFFIIVAVALLVQFRITAQNKTSELNLLPWPENIKLGNDKFVINQNFNLSITGNFNKRIYNASNSFLRRLDGRTGLFFRQGIIQSSVKFNEHPPFKINIKRAGDVRLYEDESYTLKITDKSILLDATTDIGAIRGLETLLQLQQNTNSVFYFPEVTIVDKPRFPWRGLMFDVARHFQPINVIKRNLDAMATVKMNVFHWHLSDDQGFRVEIKKRPKLHELASDGLFYTHEQIKEIVTYASERGIIVVPEIDVPGHATAILTAYPEIGSKEESYQIERNAGIFDPTLDPTNKKTYEILEDVFKELAELFPGKYFHIGGDENEGKHWDENEEIQKFKKQHGLITNHDLQTYFNIKLQKILKKYDKEVMGWEEIMTPTMPNSALIHSWKGVNEGLPAKQSLVAAVKNGYKTILSNGYYIDLMYPVAQHYLVDPMPDIELTKEEKNNILGGEATMWSELVTPLTIDSRIWPRTAAIAERFWSPKEINDVENMLKRLQTVSFRLEELGIMHIRNKALILRNITNNQEINSLVVLTKVCEPLKGYTRNKGGTEYQSYSPFTLFSDACTADASDGLKFKKAVRNFLMYSISEHKDEVLFYLNKWISAYEKFEKLDKNPLLIEIEPSFKDLAFLSKIYKEVLMTKICSPEQFKSISDLLNRLQTPFVDVELVIYNDLEKLSEFIKD